MEPDGLNELKTYLYNKYYAIDTSVAKECLEAMNAFNSVTNNKDDIATLYGSYYVTEFDGSKYNTQAGYREEIVDKDLGIVRKINLN